MLDKEWGKCTHHRIRTFIDLNACNVVSSVKVGRTGHDVACVGGETGNQFIVEIANNCILEKLGIGLLDHAVDVSSPRKGVDRTNRALGGNVPFDLLLFFDASTWLFGRKALKRECMDGRRARERGKPDIDGFKVLFSRLSRCFDLEQTLFQYNGGVVDIEVLVAGIEAKRGMRRIHGGCLLFLPFNTSIFIANRMKN
jgi:hypothetical protein